MNNIDRLDWEILNAMADDCENLEQIYLSTCAVVGYVENNGSCTRGRLLTEIAERLRRLVDLGFLTPVMDEEGRPITNAADLSYVWRAWFSMTALGRNAWASSEYANLVEQKARR